MAGFRPNHLHVEPPSDRAIRFRGQIIGTEITGGESFVHVSHGDDRWVALVHGVHDIAGGTERDVFVDPKHVYVFGEDDRLVSAATYAAAA